MIKSYAILWVICANKTLKNNLIVYNSVAKYALNI